MCLLCFSTEPLRQDELNKGKYGNAYGQFISETENKFQTTLCKAPCAEPGCWCASVICCVGLITNAVKDYMVVAVVYNQVR